MARNRSAIDHDFVVAALYPRSKMGDEARTQVLAAF